MFDTHCHLNFRRFRKNVDEVIQRARESGVKKIVIPGTDLKTSRKAVEIAQDHDDIHAAAGVHPHHVFNLLTKDELTIDSELETIEDLLQNEEVVAVGEIGLDWHVYVDTKYEQYVVDPRFVQLQKELFKKQLQLAKKYQKSVIFHNREAAEDILLLLSELWDSQFNNRSVLHCSEPDQQILQFAKEHQMFIGVDGDLTYWEEKQAFIREVPLSMLVLETDSPFLLPEPLKSQKKYPNEPKNLIFIADKVAELKKVSVEEVLQRTTENGERLFGLHR